MPQPPNGSAVNPSSTRTAVGHSRWAIAATSPVNHANSKPSRVHGGVNSSSMLAKDADDTLHLRIAWLGVIQHVGLQFSILNVEQALECAALIICGSWIALLEIALQQLIELAHATPALPGKTTQ
jgi:hypothetical protein